MQVRKSQERGSFDHGWLQAQHSFSFGEYRDPCWNGFHTLRVINEDRIQPGGGFGTHGHRDMEILTYLISGELAHKDSLGNGSTIHPGEWQYMSAGKGVLHSEFNPRSDRPNHLLQIWIIPDSFALPPRYNQKSATSSEWDLIASPTGEKGSIALRQDAFLWQGRLSKKLSFEVKDGRACWIQMIAGALSVQGIQLQAGDGASEESPGTLDFTPCPSHQTTEFLVFDLPRAS